MSEETITVNLDSAEELVDLIVAEEEKLQKAIEEVYSRLAAKVDKTLQERMSTRKVKEAQWMEAAQLYLGGLAWPNYHSNDFPFGIENSKIAERRPEHNIVRNKCETAIAQTMAYQFAAGDKNWDLRPPENGDAIDEQDMLAIMQMQGQQMSPEQVMNYKISMMEKEMASHLERSNYAIEARKAAWDRVVLGTGIMKGPTNATQLRKVWGKSYTSDGQVVRVPYMKAEHVPCIYRVDPWYFFPDDSVTDISDAEDTIEVHLMSKMQLKELLQNPGYFQEQILEVLEEEPKTYDNSPFTDPSYLTQGRNVYKNRYVVIEYHGPMCRKDLETIGRTPVIDSPDDEYYVELWVVNGRVIRLEYENLEGSYKCPYAVSVWEPDPATLFGFGIPMLVRDQQRVVNETYKMLLDNAGISAGPQVIVDTTILEPAEGGVVCEPWKVWLIKEFGQDASKAIQFFMPPNAFEGLSALFNMSMGLADMESSIPNLSMGMNNPTGAPASATGMAIAQQNAASPLFYKSEQWDDQITKPIIQMLYEWEMQYNPKEEIKGYFDIDVRTSTSFLQSSMEQQKLERLRMEISQGSPLGEWINMDQLAQVSLTDMRLPYKTLVKSPEQVEQERANTPEPPPDPNLLKAQAELARVEIDKQRLELEAQKIQLELNQKHQQAVMEYQAQMRTDDIRSQEAQASVLKAQYDFQAAMAAVAAKSENDRQKILKDITVENMKQQTEKFLAGVESQLRVQDQSLVNKEMEIKRQTGSGI